MASLIGSLQSAANNIVSINRSSSGMNRTQNSYASFLRFMEVETGALKSIVIDKKKLNKALSANVSTSFGNTGNLLGGLLNGALDIGGFLSNFAGGGRQTKTPKPQLRGGKVRLPGARGLAILTPLLAGLDFAQGISEGESVGKAASGAAGAAVGAAGGALAGTALAGMIGQALVPVPGLGFVLGAAVGSLGSFAGGYLADRAYESATGESKGGKEGITRRLREEEQKQKVKAASLGKLTFPQVLDKFESVIINFERAAYNLSGPQTSSETFEDLGETIKDNENIDYRPEDSETFTPTGDGEEVFPLVGGRPVLTSEKNGGGFNSPRAGRPRHNGQDIGVDANTPVVASRSGKVVAIAGNYGGVGSGIWIKYDNGQTGTYGHVNPSGVRVGDKVEAGQKIATVTPWKTKSGDNTHLHYMRQSTGGQYIDPKPILEGSKSGKPLAKADTKKDQPKGKELDSGDSQVQAMATPQNKMMSKSAPTTAAAKPSQNLSQMSMDQLKGMLDPTKTGASNPAVFQAASRAREDGKTIGLSGEDLERQVLIASIQASQNTSMVNVPSPVQKSIPQQIQQYPSYNQAQSSMTIVPMMQAAPGQKQQPMVISAGGGSSKTIVLPGPSDSQVLNSLLKDMLLTNLSSA